VTLEALPSSVAVVFTTTVNGEDKLFEDCADSHPLLSRCAVIALSRRDLARLLAERAKAIAVAEGLEGHIRLAQQYHDNLREMLQVIEVGGTLAKAE
jgi:DNA polymerase III delta prime subunit